MAYISLFPCAKIFSDRQLIWFIYFAWSTFPRISALQQQRLWQMFPSSPFHGHGWPSHPSSFPSIQFNASSLLWLAAMERDQFFLQGLSLGRVQPLRTTWSSNPWLGRLFLRINLEAHAIPFVRISLVAYYSLSTNRLVWFNFVFRSPIIGRYYNSCNFFKKQTSLYQISLLL